MRWIQLIGLMMVGFLMVSCSSGDSDLPTVVVLPTEGLSSELTMVAVVANMTILPTESLFVSQSDQPVVELVLQDVTESRVIPDHNLQSILVETGDMNIRLLGVSVYQGIKNKTPDNDIFLVVHGSLESLNGRSACLKDENVRLVVGSVTYETQLNVANDYKSSLSSEIDYPGRMLGHCVKSEEATFFVFDVPLDDAGLSLDLLGKSVKLPIRLPLAPTATPSATHTALPTATIMPTTTAMLVAFVTNEPKSNPSPTITPTPLPTATPTVSTRRQLAESLEVAMSEVDGVVSVEVATVTLVDDGNDMVYAEVTVAKGFNNPGTADALRQLSYSTLVSAFVDFSVIIADGQTAPIDYVWSNQTDSWKTTIMESFAPASVASVGNVTVFTPVIYVVSNQANVRSCPQATDDCSVVATLGAGENITLNGSVTGQSVSGNTLWYRGTHNNKEVYVHSSLVQKYTASTGSSNTTTTTTTTTTNSEPALARPDNCTQAVEWGYTDVQAAQWSHLDRDHDGVACYGD